MNNLSFKVLVQCSTFNHSQYILDALNGFAMQRTSFPFVCCIIDDASTDGEQDVLKEFIQTDLLNQEARIEETDYANIVFAPHRNNPNCYFAILLLKENHYQQRKPKLPYIKEWIDKSEYVALCEGDDYWIVPDKLQRQVDWLDAHPDYTMCCSDAKVTVGERELNWSRYCRDSDITLAEMIEGGGLFIQTVTVIYRKEIKGYLQEPFIRQCNTGDYSLQIMCAYKGKVRYLFDKTAVYRYRTPGSWSYKDKHDNIEKLLKNWRSVVKMLDGFDAYMNYQASEAIKKRKIDYIVQKYRIYWDHRFLISKEFSDVFDLMSMSEKLKFWFSVSRLKIWMNVLSQKLKALMK